MDLVAKRRSMIGQTWDDDQHIDIVQAVDDLQDDLREEKKRLDALIKGAPLTETVKFALMP
jgi:hypothetical protein